MPSWSQSWFHSSLLLSIPPSKKNFQISTSLCIIVANVLSSRFTLIRTKDNNTQRDATHFISRSTPSTMVSLYDQEKKNTPSRWPNNSRVMLSIFRTPNGQIRMHVQIDVLRRPQTVVRCVRRRSTEARGRTEGPPFELLHRAHPS